MKRSRICPTKRSKQAGRGDGIEVVEGIILLRMGRLVALGEKGKTKGVITKLSGMGLKGLVSLIRGDIIMFFCVPGFAWEVDGIRLNATESYFVSVAIGVLRQMGTSSRPIYISRRNSLLPRVYGKIQMEVSDGLAGVIIYMKGVQSLRVRSIWTVR